MSLIQIVLIFLYMTTIDALLCYNGTFSYKDSGDDPVTTRGWFSPSRRTISRMRCALTILCPGLFCYNCSSTQALKQNCAGEFAPPYLPFNSTRHFLVNCTAETAMCFVRSWRARAKHAWIVQRGCYNADKDDPIPRSMNNPTRAMTCKSQRFIEAEYKVCLCQADWCNPACINVISHTQFLVYSAIVMLVYALNTCSHIL